MVEEAMQRRRIEKIIRNTETHGTHYAGRYFNENIAETKRAKKKKKKYDREAGREWKRWRGMYRGRLRNCLWFRFLYTLNSRGLSCSLCWPYIYTISSFAWSPPTILSILCSSALCRLWSVHCTFAILQLAECICQMSVAASVVSFDFSDCNTKLHFSAMRNIEIKSTNASHKVLASKIADDDGGGST